jgi:hypothetical protein
MESNKSQTALGDRLFRGLFFSIISTVKASWNAIKHTTHSDRPFRRFLSH